MTETIKNGGPAFPVFPETGAAHEAAFRGMSLRDYFAAKAMQALLSDRATMATADKRSSENGIDCPKYLALGAYGFADAMLAAREVKA